MCMGGCGGKKSAPAKKSMPAYKPKKTAASVMNRPSVFGAPRIRMSFSSSKNRT